MTIPDGMRRTIHHKTSAEMGQRLKQSVGADCWKLYKVYNNHTITYYDSDVIDNRDDLDYTSIIEHLLPEQTLYMKFYQIDSVFETIICIDKSPGGWNTYEYLEIIP
jgi:hypothetical protein